MSEEPPKKKRRKEQPEIKESEPEAVAAPIALSDPLDTPIASAAEPNKTAKDPVAAAPALSFHPAAAMVTASSVEIRQPGLEAAAKPADEPTAEPLAAPTSADSLFRPGPFEETVPLSFTIGPAHLKGQSRRDFLLFGAGIIAAAAGFWWLLPQETQTANLTMAQQQWLDSLEARVSPRLAGSSAAVKSKFLDRVLTFDDDVASALFSPGRNVPTYRADQITPNLRNNYDGQTPDPGYLASWKLGLSGLASGRNESVGLGELSARFPRHDEITRLVCVEGWSAIAGWGGLRFSDLLAAYPPDPRAKWAQLRSEVNLDGDGNSDPYYVSIDLRTASHPQVLLATHHDGKELDVPHGAPLRLIVPMKLGLKNIKAVTSITYTAEQPADYWNDRGYSKYDGI